MVLTFGEYALFSGLFFIFVWAILSWVGDICDEYLPRLKWWWLHTPYWCVPTIVWAIIISMVFQLIVFFSVFFTTPFPGAVK